MTIQHLFKTAPITTLLLVSFIGLYVLQVLTGVDPNNPSTAALVKWGANVLPLTLANDPWRLVSSAFLHIGLMHLLFNGFAMYFFGQVAEPMFGSIKFLLLFLLAAIGGNLLNNEVVLHGILAGTAQVGLSAGASGGIMGIGGALLMAAFFKMSVNGLVLNLKSLIVIMGINLVYGFAVAGIDNAAHIGGALIGSVIALSIAIAQRPSMPRKKSAAYCQGNRTADWARQTDTEHAIPINLRANANLTDPQFNARRGFPPPPLSDKSAFISQSLPWGIIVLISMGFVWWWQAMHTQLLQVLKLLQ